jgi:hypothetical protein
MVTALIKLQAARALIADPKNWVQGPNNDKVFQPPFYCVGTALNSIAGFYPDNLKVYNYLELSGIPMLDLIKWNDNPIRTHKEILDIFDKAIALAKADSIKG